MLPTAAIAPVALRPLLSVRQGGEEERREVSRKGEGAEEKGKTEEEEEEGEREVEEEGGNSRGEEEEK